jgi:LacI family transcriptional regulator
VLHGAEAAAREAGYALIFSTAEGRADLAADYIRLLRQRRVDGFVLALADAEHPAVRLELERVQVPCVLYDRELDWLDASCVLLDHGPGARETAARLAELGHRRIGFVAGAPTMRTTTEVATGLGAVLEDVDGATLQVAEGAFTAEHGRASAIALLQGAEPPTALVAGNAQIAQGVIVALRELRLRPGHDVSLVCAEDPPMLRLLEPSVAAIHWDFALVGRRLAGLLLKRLAGEPPERVVLPATFLPGDSCARVAASAVA